MRGILAFEGLNLEFQIGNLSEERFVLRIPSRFFTNPSLFFSEPSNLFSLPIRVIRRRRRGMNWRVLEEMQGVTSKKLLFPRKGDGSFAIKAVHLLYSYFATHLGFHLLSFSKHSLGKHRVVAQFTTREIYKLSAPIATILKGTPYLRKSSSRCYCLGTLINPDSATPLTWVPIVDQVLLLAGVVLAYMAGVLPSENTFFNSRRNISDHGAVPTNTSPSGSAMKSDHQANSNRAWDEVKGKLIGALDAIEYDNNLENKVVEREKFSVKRPLSLCAIAEGPRLRLLWATLQRLEKEARTLFYLLIALVNNISGNYEIANRDDWLAVLSKVVRNSSQPVCLAWLEAELYPESREPEKELFSVMFEKLEGNDTILQNIRKSGKEDLYADLLFFLRFGSLGVGCRYDSKLLTKHEVDILEDLVIALADGMTSIYLELISVDSNMPSEMNDLGLILCSLSTRELQKLRNEVVFSQWLHQNMESVVSMYEDRLDLCTLRIQLLEEPNKHQTAKLHWWKNLTLRKLVSTVSPFHYVMISQLSMPIKRTKELRALTGWYILTPYLTFLLYATKHFLKILEDLKRKLIFSCY
ncbi:hypothetical protein HHK36_027056 [Tetracentron sinense]|uniref:Uncharacterized protein n=1 Tax=Tetracentron sinense TaxID=13715 RepID=A0A834YGY6_TETSI|nr:hypothetical protein HHK36_027056 [Tetracentron sinense]